MRTVRLLGREGRRHVDPGGVVGQPEQVGLVARAAPASPRTARRRARRRNAARRNGAGTTLRIASVTSPSIASAAAGSVAVAPALRWISSSEWSASVSSRLTTCCSPKWKSSSAPVASGSRWKWSDQRDRQRLQRRGRRCRQLFEHRMRSRLRRRQRAQRGQQRGECRTQRRRRGRHRRGQRRGAQFGAEHPARAVDEVVRFVDQQRQPPVERLPQRPQRAVGVERMVDVADQHIAPAQQFLAQVVRADAVAQRDRPLRRRVEPAGADRVGAGRRQPVVEAARQRARVAVAGLVRVFAGLVLGDDRQHAQRTARGGRPQSGQRSHRAGAAGALAGQVGDLVDARRRHRPQHRITACRRSCRCRSAPAPASVRPLAPARQTAAARSRCPGLNAGCGKPSDASAASRALRCAASCAAQSAKAAQRSANADSSSAAPHSCRSSTSVCVAVSK